MHIKSAEVYLENNILIKKIFFKIIFLYYENNNSRCKCDN